MQPEAVATVATVAARDAEDRTLPVIAVAVAVAAVAVAVAALRHLDRRVRSQSAISTVLLHTWCVRAATAATAWCVRAATATTA